MSSVFNAAFVAEESENQKAAALEGGTKKRAALEARTKKGPPWKAAQVNREASKKHQVG
jgi:hypothetical protein